MKKNLVLFPLLFGLMFAHGQQQIGLSLTVNNELADTIYSGQPVVFNLHLTNNAAQNSFAWNLANKRRMDELEELYQAKKISNEAYEKEKNALAGKMKKTEPIQLGSANLPWYQELKWMVSGPSAIALNPTLLPYPAAASMLYLDENSYSTIVFGIAPETVDRIRAGAVTVYVVLGNARSNTISLNFTGQPAPALVAGNEAMVLKEADYYTHTGNTVKMISLADKLLAKQPASIEGLVLKADALYMQKMYDASLELYNKALVEYYRQYGNNAEPPEYILSAIFQLKSERGK